MKFKINSSNIVFKGKVFDIKIDQILYDSGNSGVREIVLHKGGAVVLAITKEKRIILVKQYRWPLKKFFLELPAGKLEKNEDPLDCAKRELLEETGITAEKFVKLGTIATSPGFCSELLHIYLAERLTRGIHNREEGEEGMEIFEFTLDEIKNMIMKGEIIDSKTICGIYYYKHLE